MHLRYQATLLDIAGEKNSTVVFPFPIDLVTHLIPSMAGASDDAGRER